MDTLVTTASLGLVIQLLAKMEEPSCRMEPLVLASALLVIVGQRVKLPLVTRSTCVKMGEHVRSSAARMSVLVQQVSRVLTVR